MDSAVGGDGLLARQPVWASSAIRDAASGLLDDQPTRGQVPGVELPLPEPVEAAAGHVAQVERRGAGATHPLCLPYRFAPEGEVEVRVLPLVVRKAGSEERTVELVHRGELDRGAIQARAGAAERREELLADGIVNQPEEELVVAGERDRDREVRVAVGEVGGAIERVDVPAMAVATGAAGGLLGMDAVLREGGRYHVDDQPLGFSIDRGHEVHLTLEGDVLPIPVARANERAGTGRRRAPRVRSEARRLVPHGVPEGNDERRLS